MGAIRVGLTMTVALFALLVADTAVGATLKADYQLDGNLSSEVADAPDLTVIGPAGRFATESVDGSRRTVFAFPKGGGLSLATAGLVDSRNHSVALLFRLRNTSSWRRILDFANGRSDNGLYNFNGKVDLYFNGSRLSSGTVFTPNAYALVTMTNQAGPSGSVKSTVYVNGARVNSRVAAGSFNLNKGVLRLFKDDTGTFTGEESAGALACLLVYDGVLTAAEVDLLAANQDLCPAPRARPGRTVARAVGKPRAMSPVIVDTGLAIKCPIGTTACKATSSVSAIGRKASGSRRGRLLGKASFKVQAGDSGRVAVKLSRRGAKMLRRKGALRVIANTQITLLGGDRPATARVAGWIKSP